jgi:hypothetical protein
VTRRIAPEEGGGRLPLGDRQLGMQCTGQPRRFIPVLVERGMLDRDQVFHISSGDSRQSRDESSQGLCQARHLVPGREWKVVKERGAGNTLHLHDLVRDEPDRLWHWKRAARSERPQQARLSRGAQAATALQSASQDCGPITVVHDLVVLSAVTGSGHPEAP